MAASGEAGAGGQVDFVQAQQPHSRCDGQHGQVRAGCGRAEDLRLYLGRLLRLVYRADQDPPPGGGRGQQGPGAAGAVLGADGDAQAAPPLYALHYGGNLAGPAPRGGLPHAPGLAQVQ